MNGAAALLFTSTLEPAWVGRLAPRVLVMLDTDAQGRVARVWSVMAPRKMSAPLGRADDGASAWSTCAQLFPETAATARHA